MQERLSSKPRKTLIIEEKIAMLVEALSTA